jgi:1A family penicillin-binding protein
VFVALGIFALWVSSLKIPDLESVGERRVAQSTKIFDRTGEVLLFDVHEGAQRTVVSLDEMSRHVRNATIAIEDSEFYAHKGIKVKSIMRAVLANISSAEYSQGGSTITQQVIKNALLTKEKAISRKVKEWVLAMKLEQVMEKDQILELYLNETPYGGSIYGVEEASIAFFSKTSAELTLAESAYLAALPQAPTYYSPNGPNRDALETRKNLVLSRMLALGFINQEEHDAALKEEVVFSPKPEISLLAPHFTLWVKEQLERKYGSAVVESGGLRVTTSLDYALQAKTEKIVKKHALENAAAYNAENASLVAIDPNNGQILALIGSRDYFDEEIDGNYNVALLGRRQPGSAFKPFVYATAFEKGYTPDTVVFDVRTQFSTACGPAEVYRTEAPCYSPGNYDNIFRGPMTLRNALAQSVNVPAVKVLYLAGLQDSLKTSQRMGISTLGKIGQYGLTLVLGGGEVSLLEMTSAYGSFATGGTRYPYVSILKVEDAKGNVLEENAPRGTRVLSEETALRISDVLADNEARTPAFGARSFLYFPGRDVAVKTGTTNDYKDAWIIGYTPQIVVGAWAGNNDGTSMEKRVAGFIVAPMWNEVMQEALATRSNVAFKKPPAYALSELKPMLRGDWSGGQTYVVDKISGKLATEHTPTETREERVVKSVHSILHWVDTREPRGAIPANPASDGQYLLWEYPVRMWATANGHQDQNADEIIPKESDDVHTPDKTPKIEILGIDDGKSYKKEDSLNLNIKTDKDDQLKKVEIFLNGGYIGALTSSPFTFSLDLEGNSLIAEDNALRVVGYDEHMNKGEVAVHFMVKE